MIKVIIAEDQSLLRGAIGTLLSLEADIDVVASAEDGQQALELVTKHAPDVLVTDIEMPKLTGIELAEQLKRAGSPVHVLVVTTFARPGYLHRAMKAGVKGYVLKDAPSDELADAVRKVAAGRRVVAAELEEAAWMGADPLTVREREILKLVEDGKSNKEIAEDLGLSPGTVRNYLAEAAQKIGASNRIEAFRKAKEFGWL